MKLFQTDGLGLMDQSLDPLFPCYDTIGFFLLRLCKGSSISSKVGTVVELHAQINKAAASMTSQMLEDTWHEIECCLDILGVQMVLTLRCIELDELFFQVK
jgi:hypothetical protein